jgi:hypothetical protein
VGLPGSQHVGQPRQGPSCRQSSSRPGSLAPPALSLAPAAFLTAALQQPLAALASPSSPGSSGSASGLWREVGLSHVGLAGCKPLAAAPHIIIIIRFSRSQCRGWDPGQRSL